MSTLPELWAELGDTAGAQLQATYDRLLAEGVPERTILRHLSLGIVTHNKRAIIRGEAAAKLQLQQWEASIASVTAPATATATHTNRDRLASAVGTILERAGDSEEERESARRAIHRLGRSEAVDSAQDSMRGAMLKHPLARGWRRVVESDACELCQWLARGDRVFPRSVPINKHPGCVCAQRFVRTEPDRTLSKNERERDRRQEQRRKQLRDETPEQRAERERRAAAVRKRLEGD